jgi:Fe2+ transport system protein FeoA
MPLDGPTLADLPTGRSARVTEIHTEDAGRLTLLASLGILPGVLVTVIQRLPEMVVRVGETEWALDTSTSRAICLAPWDP